MKASPFFHGGWHRFQRTLLDVFFPQGNACHSCGQPMLRKGEPLLCDACHQALEAALLPQDEQGLFLDAFLPQAFAAYRHESTPRTLVHRLKYGSDRAAAIPLAAGLARVYALTNDEVLRRGDALVPVPLHPKRERERGFNQSQVLGLHLSAHIGLPLLEDALQRVRPTRRQVGGNRDFRRRNVQGAFAVPDDARVRGRHILLLDDVCTTGATAISCAEALLLAGADEVSLLTVCRA